MKKRIAMLLLFVFGMTSVIALGADPGGYPGLLVAKFNAGYDTTSDIRANAFGRVYEPSEMYATSLSSYTTYGWSGYMWMEGGVTYNFKGCYDDFTTVKINGSWVYTRGGDCVERQGSYTPTRSDWFLVEFRAGNNGGAGGCQNSSQYGILWNTSQDSTWRRIGAYVNGIIFKTGATTAKSVSASSAPFVISSSIRSNDPTILDTRFIVFSDNATVNVRALAFEDGERSFWKIIRPETFVDGTEANVGDNIAANVEHTLSWKIDRDWNTDIAKVKFEILTSDMAQLPLKVQKIPALGRYPTLTVAYNEQSDADIFNALLWWYADGDPTLVIENGYVDVGGVRWINRTSIDGNARMPILTWLYGKMGWEPLMGGNLMSYVRNTLRKELWYNASIRNSVILQATKPEELYIGDKAYMVVDLAEGQDAKLYPVTFLSTEPVNGWDDSYKTTKLLMRKISAGRFNMRNDRDGDKFVTLTKSFYIGVFEVTQKQYELVMGINPSRYKGDMRPVEMVSWDDVRGNSSRCNWPTVKIIDGDTFIGRLRNKTMQNFDLPTEAQWEYACRAGTYNSFNNGGRGVWCGINYDLRALGRYGNDRNDGRGGFSEHTVVGSYQPNFWGLFDMHGNILELCLDWSSDPNNDSEVDPIGPEDGSKRAARGGYWSCASLHDDTVEDNVARSYGTGNSASSRHGINPSGRSDTVGFRLCLTVE